MSTLYLPVGPPGCGKSTFARRAVDSDLITLDAIVSTDETRRLLTGAVGNMSEDDIVFWIVQNVVKTRLKHDLDVWLDATNINNKYRNEAIQGLPEGTKIVTVLFDDVTDKTCYEQNALRPTDNGRVPDEAMARMFLNFRQVKREELPGEVYSSKTFAGRFLRDDFKPGDKVLVHLNRDGKDEITPAVVDNVTKDRIFIMSMDWTCHFYWDQYNNKELPIWFERENA